MKMNLFCFSGTLYLIFTLITSALGHQCDIDCQNGGVCYEVCYTFLCACDVGWSGSRCNKRVPTTLAPCPEMTTPAMTDGSGASPVVTCQGIGDLVFIVDASYSGNNENWKYVVNFLEEIVKSIPTDMTKYRVGIVRFDENVSNIYYLKSLFWYQGRFEGQGRPAVIRRIQRIRRPYDSRRNTALALQKTAQTQFTSKQGDRKEIPNLVVLVTDGRSTSNADMTTAAANDLQSVARVFVVGVGDQTLMKPEQEAYLQELRQIASLPEDVGETVFMSPDFSSLTSIKDMVVTEMCRYMGMYITIDRCRPATV